MSIDWIAFIQVALATLVSSLVMVGAYGLGVRLQAVAEDEGRSSAGYRVGSWVCFGVAGLVVLFGIVLIVPHFSRLIGL